MEAKEEKQLLRFRKQIKQLDLIVLDELGYVPTGKVGAELLFDVLSTAYERQSLIVTTNLPFEQWTEVLGSERLTGAALDRLTHRCHILEAKAKASGSGTPADGSGEQPARPEPAILGATSYPGVDSTHPQRCTFRPPRAALFNRRSQIAEIRLPNGTRRLAEVHWYESHGVGRKEFTIKRFLKA